MPGALSHEVQRRNRTRGSPSRARFSRLSWNKASDSTERPASSLFAKSSPSSSYHSDSNFASWPTSSRLDEVRSRNQTGPTDSNHDDYPLVRIQPIARLDALEGASRDSSLTLASSSSDRPPPRLEAYTSFFDDYAARHSQDSDGNDQDNSASTSTSSRDRPLSTAYRGADDESEDLRDLHAVVCSESIRMNLEALRRSAAHHYAYTADGYSDPNAHYDFKPIEGNTEGDWLDHSYAHLISKLSVAHDQVKRGSVHKEPFEVGRGDFDQPRVLRGHVTPDISPSRDTPPSTSLSSGRSSSEAHEDGLKTPPETSVDVLHPSVQPQYHGTAPAPLTHSVEAPMLSTASSAQASGTGSSSALGTLRESVKAQSQQQPLAQHRLSQTDALPGFNVGDSSELELLSDDHDAQRRAAGKARMTPSESDSRISPSSAASSQTGHSHGRRRSSFNMLGENRPFARLCPQDIAFSASSL